MLLCQFNTFKIIYFVKLPYRYGFISSITSHRITQYDICLITLKFVQIKFFKKVLYYLTVCTPYNVIFCNRKIKTYSIVNFLVQTNQNLRIVNSIYHKKCQLITKASHYMFIQKYIEPIDQLHADIQVSIYQINIYIYSDEVRKIIKEGQK